jgi:hypothetical protein
VIVRETLHCPGCEAELTIPASVDGQVQCPRCQHIFDPAARWNAAVTTAVPIAATREDVDDHERFAPMPRLTKTYSLIGGWFAYLFSLTLIANAVVFSLWAYAFFERSQLPEAGGAGLAEHFRFVSRIEDAAGIALWPVFPSFVIWSFIAGRNARILNIDGMLPRSTLIVAFICCPVSLVVGYLHLQQLWQASDPHEIEDSESWRKVNPSIWIRAWAGLCLAVPVLAMVGSQFDQARRNQAVALASMLTSLSWVFACLLLIVVVHWIGRRQFERYIRLYEDPA